MSDLGKLVSAIVGLWFLVMLHSLITGIVDGIENLLTGKTPEAPWVADAIDLGEAQYPAGVEDFSLARHHWRFSRQSPLYQLAYLHGDAAGAGVKADHARLAERFDYQPLAGNSFTWRAPENCRGREWGCVYSQVYKRSALDLEPLIWRLKTYALEQRWTRTDIARWLLAFVQQIEYRLPKRYAFGLLPPALVASQSWGDCDSKSLLLMFLLAEFDIDSRLLISSAHAHALLGVNVASSGEGFHHRGRHYVWAETTAEDAPLGWRHPKFKFPDDWSVVRML